LITETRAILLLLLLPRSSLHLSTFSSHEARGRDRISSSSLEGVRGRGVEGEGEEGNLSGQDQCRTLDRVGGSFKRILYVFILTFSQKIPFPTQYADRTARK
jgi:hypothetical protein